MKKLLIFISAALIMLVSCEKGDDISSNELSLKKKPATNQGSTGGGNQNAFAIATPNGEDPLYINIGEVVQLTVTPDPNLTCQWYVIDQQIAYVNWIGQVTGVSVGATQITAVHYKPNGQPYQDNLVVYVGTNY